MAVKPLVGTSGWNYPHWKGCFYPEDIPKKNWFDYYAQHFDTVEINNTFYRWPTPEMLKRWHDGSPKGFRFTLKAPRTITHIKRLKDAPSYLQDFYRITKNLGKKMGCHLFQLPPNFQKNETNIERLKAFLGALDKRKDNAVEFRNEDWFHADIFALFRKYNVSLCVTPEHDIAFTGKLAYLRFHGEERYSSETIHYFAQRMRDCHGKAYCYFNNDHKAYAALNAKELKEVIG
ncbi:MAG: DUF72 domain-containing protein [Nanobdellota archaeon]